MHFPHVCKLHWSDLVGVRLFFLHRPFKSQSLNRTISTAAAAAATAVTAKTIITQLSRYIFNAQMHKCTLKYTCIQIGSTNLVSTIYCSSTIRLKCDAIRCTWYSQYCEPRATYLVSFKRWYCCCWSCRMIFWFPIKWFILNELLENTSPFSTVYPYFSHWQLRMHY